MLIAQFIPDQPARQSFIPGPRRPLLNADDAVQSGTHAADPENAFAVFQSCYYAVAGESLFVRDGSPLAIDALEQSAERWHQQVSFLIDTGETIRIHRGDAVVVRHHPMGFGIQARDMLNRTQPQCAAAVEYQGDYSVRRQARDGLQFPFR